MRWKASERIVVFAKADIQPLWNLRHSISRRAWEVSNGARQRGLGRMPWMACIQNRRPTYQLLAMINRIFRISSYTWSWDLKWEKNQENWVQCVIETPCSVVTYLVRAINHVATKSTTLSACLSKKIIKTGLFVLWTKMQITKQSTWMNRNEKIRFNSIK